MPEMTSTATRNSHHLPIAYQLTSHRFWRRRYGALSMRIGFEPHTGHGNGWVDTAGKGLLTKVFAWRPGKWPKWRKWWLMCFLISPSFDLTNEMPVRMVFWTALLFEGRWLSSTLSICSFWAIWSGKRLLGHWRLWRLMIAWCDGFWIHRQVVNGCNALWTCQLFKQS